jgi:flagellar hook-basal body complex protein FliE
MQTAGPTFDSLLGQARSVQDGLGTVGQQLQTPNLKLKRSQAHLLKNKLQDTNEYINSAANKLDVETTPQKGDASASPVGRFLAYIGNGQDQMNAVQKKLEELSKTNGQIQPGDMLLVQVKMSQAQQEIEYSSTLLGKVIDSIKTIMNTQL